MQTSAQATLQAADHQVLFVVQSIHSVAKSIEHHRESYRYTGAMDQRRALRDVLLNDIERLSNLVNLLLSVPEHDLNPATCRVLKECLDHLRNRVSAIGANITLDKIRELRSQAEGSSSRHEHPLGKSYRLREHFLRYLEQLRSLVNGLSPENAEDLRTSAVSINSLIENDIHQETLRSFIDDQPLTLIDLRLLNFPALQEDFAAAFSPPVLS